MKIFLAVITLILLPFRLVWWGYALTVLWGWFIVPTFSAPVLSIPVAIGIFFIMGFINYKLEKPGDDGDEEKDYLDIFLINLLTGALTPVPYLLLGYIVKACM